MHNRSTDHFLLDLNKCFRSSARPSKFTLLETVRNWGRDSAKPFDKPTIKSHEPMKASHITDGLRLGPFLDGSDFLGIRRNSINRDYKS